MFNRGPSRYSLLTARWPSRSAEFIYNALLDVSTANRETLADCLLEAKKEIAKNIKALGELNDNKMSFLDIALYAPLEKNSDQKYAVTISERLFGLVLDEMQEKLTTQILSKILANKDIAGFTLLHRALTINSVVNLRSISDILNVPERKTIWFANLTTPNNDGFIPLESAVLLCSKTVKEEFYYLLESMDEALNFSLVHKSRSGFMILLACLKEGSDEDVEHILTLLSRKGCSSLLQKNLCNNTTDLFMVLQTAINSKSRFKIAAVMNLLRKEENKEILLLNLKNKTANRFTTLSSALATGIIEIVNDVISFYLESGNEELLQDHLKEVTMEGSCCLQVAIFSKSVQVVKRLGEFLSQKKYERRLDFNLENRTQNGFMVLQEALKLGEPEMVEVVVGMLRNAPRSIIIKNLKNTTRAGFNVVVDAVRSNQLRNITLTFNLCRQYLDQDFLQSLLLKESQQGVTCLHSAVYTGKVEIVEEVIAFIKTIFGTKADEKIRYLVKRGAFARLPRISEAFKKIEQYFPEYEQAGDKTPQELENSARYVYKLLLRAVHSTTETEFKNNYKTLESAIEKYPEQLTQLSDNGTSLLAIAIQKPEKNTQNTTFAKKVAVQLFRLIFSAIKKLGQKAFATVLNAKTADGKKLMMQVVEFENEEILDTLIELFNRDQYKELLIEQLDAVTKDGFMILQYAVLSRSAITLAKILTLLSSHPKQLRKNLSNRSRDGYMPLHDAVRTGAHAIISKIADILSFKEYQPILQSNLENVTKHHYSLLQDIVKYGTIESISLIIKLSEDNLKRESWQNVLRMKNINRKQCNILEQVVNKADDFDKVEVIAKAIIRAFGDDAQDTMQKMMALTQNFHRQHLFARLRNFVASYDFSKKETLEEATLAESLAPTQWSIEDGIEEVVEPSLQLGTREVNPELEELLDKAKTQKEQPLFDLEMLTPIALGPLEIVPPCGGIDAKYLGGALPELPEALPEEETASTLAPTYAFEYQFKQLKSLSGPSFKELEARTKYSLENRSLSVDYYSRWEKPNSDDKITFVLAGRKQEAFIPQPKCGRCVVVLTEPEYNALEKQIPIGIDLLVIKALSSRTHGTYTNLGMPTSRRIAIFLIAHHFNLETFLMIDDNIKMVRHNARSEDWDHLYGLLENQLNSLCCISVRTFSNRKSKEGQLGSKMFMVNMERIKKYIPRLRDLYILFPQALNQEYWGEDYHFQVAFYTLVDGESQGYEALDKSLVTLLRSEKNRNTFAAIGKQAKPFNDLSEEALALLSPKHRNCVESTGLILNQLILDNIIRYKKRKRYLEKVNLQKVHALANQIQVLNVQDEEQSEEEEQDFLTRYRENLKCLPFKRDVFRNYQIKAMRKIGESDEQMLRLVLATGSGKTYVQCELIRVAYRIAKKGECIIVVTPYIDLVNQFFKDFIAFNEKITTEETDLRIPPEAIIKVCSHQESCRVKSLLMNKTIMQQKTVLIFCAASLDKFLEEMEYSLPNVPLILLDEYHEYFSTVQTLVEEMDPPLLIGSSATPPKDDPLSDAFFYSRSEGVSERYLAPVIADSLGVNFSHQNVQNLIYALPVLLQQFHPGFSNHLRLSDTKGILFLSSIKECELAIEILKNCRINCYNIHSKNKKHKKQLQTFLKSDLPGVLIAVKMLRVGFNAKDLAWAIIAQNGKRNHNSRATIEQEMGRLMRLFADKIGYLLCFDNVYHNLVKPMLAKQPVTFPVSVDYLSQSLVYYTDPTGEWDVCDFDSEFMEEKIKVADTGFVQKFHIEPKTLKSFSVVEVEKEEGTDFDKLKTKTEVLSYLNFDNLQTYIFSNYQESKKYKGTLVELTESFMPDLGEWVSKRMKK